MMTTPSAPISLGFSPCPNDTFIFHALVSGLLDTGPLQFAPEVLTDVENLNQWAFASRLEVTKISFHALGFLFDDYVLLTSGAALGRGCGPLLVAAQQKKRKRLAEATIAIPGRYTTAAMLLRLFAPECSRLIEMRFDAIMPALRAGTIDAGVIIHESRFTYQQHGLQLIQDLGAWWEEVSGQPIPLGGIAAKRSLGPERIHHINLLIRKSVQQAFLEPERSRGYVKMHAQEMQDEVIAEHIKLYVNSFSENLGNEGIAAVRHFLHRGREAGIFPSWRDDFFDQE